MPNDMMTDDLMTDDLMPNDTMPGEIRRLLDQFAFMAMPGDCLPDKESPIGKLTREFFANNWTNCREGLLKKTARIHVWPEPSPFPRIFKFEIQCPFKRKTGPDAPIELLPGPVRGTVYYRPNVLTANESPPVAVALDAEQAFFHPNYSRRQGFLCLGELPRVVLALDLLLENIIYPIVTYQNRRPAHAFDQEAAAYFALNPEAMMGLESVEPLY
jgi:hypothetical protein